VRLDQLLSQYDDVFGETAGKLIGPPCYALLETGRNIDFCESKIPLALRDAYAKEINSKITPSFYKRVDYSEWGSTIHVVAKKRNKIHWELQVNTQSKDDH